MYVVETVRPVASVQPGFHYSRVHYSQVRLYYHTFLQIQIPSRLYL